MDESEREDVFLINAALGTDLVTSYVAATDDKPKKPGGCLPVALGLIAAVLLLL
jgi:hypothetical protein